MDPTTTTTAPSQTTSALPGQGGVRHTNPALTFIIGLCIVLLASILNAAGLNLTKLDHVRTSAIPKASRRKDWLRPLWLIGMLLYIVSQLIGSTLALEYLRAEYVAPMGATSLVFNFLFARFLVGTPVTRTDIYGTVIVILGVIGIVAFGSINSGLSQETHAARLAYLWRRGGWLGYFFAMSFALILLLIFVSSLDAVLAARSDITSEPFAGMNARRSNPVGKTAMEKLKARWTTSMTWVKAKLETWTAAQSDKQIAWTLGIGWACCGGGLAGGCLVFAKATVKLISGSLSQENSGNQFGHVAPIFTIILLAITAVLQIICLNRGLRVYDSTLVVPVFYGVYTATGFLDSLTFNDEVGSYKSWTLALIFLSILVLISGVIMLTHKKPEPVRAPGTNNNLDRSASRKKVNSPDGKSMSADDDGEEPEEYAMRTPQDNAATGAGGAAGVAGARGTGRERWQVGDVSDEDDESGFGATKWATRKAGGESLIDVHDDGRGHRNSSSSDATVTGPAVDPFRDDSEEFVDWERLDGATTR